MSSTAPTIGILIRFSNSAQTLPAVLDALKKQTVQPNILLGVDSGSTDDSPHMIEAAGGLVIPWKERYDHAKVLNFGLRHLSCDLVLILSSHTVLEAPDTVARMVEAMEDPSTACVSGKWDADPFYSDAIDWAELQAKGLKFGSIYSNSMGMIRRNLWKQLSFDETLAGTEDYAWAIAQVAKGFICKRLSFPFSYRRSGSARNAEFSRITFQLARRHGLRVTWLGPRESLKRLLLAIFGKPTETHVHRIRLCAWLKASLALNPRR